MQRSNLLPLTLSLPKHLYCWWKLLPRIVSQKRFVGQQCSFWKRCSILECMTSGNWSQRSYGVLQICRNHFAKDIIWCHNGSEWVNNSWENSYVKAFTTVSCDDTDYNTKTQQQIINRKFEILSCFFFHLGGVYLSSFFSWSCTTKPLIPDEGK